MPRIAPRHLFAVFMLILELPIPAPIAVGAAITGGLAVTVAAARRARAALELVPKPNVLIRHEHSSPI